VLAWALCASVGATSCATLHELPRVEYAARPERKGVVVDTRDSLHYKFDYATFGPDTLIGYRLSDAEGALEDYRTVAIPLETVERLRVRRTNWLRTGLIGGGIVAAAATALVAGGSNPPAPVDSGPTLPPPPP
jgi:hypothetical protein